MLNFNRNDRFVEVKDPAKPALDTGRPAVSSSRAGVLQQQGSLGNPTTSRPSTPPTHPAAPARDVAQETAAAVPEATAAPSRSEMAGSKLFVGVNIKLKGIEISNCDVLVIEGQVEATVNSQAMEIGKPGTLTGTALIDIAEIHGEFSGELTARTKLVVHGTGHVTGTIRYGKLVVVEGGILMGDLRQIDAAAPEAQPQAAGKPPEALPQAAASPPEARTKAAASPQESRTKAPAAGSTDSRPSPQPPQAH